MATFSLKNVLNVILIIKGILGEGLLKNHMNMQLGGSANNLGVMEICMIF
jgi:hypothetical protein